MKAKAVIVELEKAAKTLSVKVSYENLRASGGMGIGGLCRVKGQYRVIIDKRAGESDRLAALAHALCRFDLDKTELSPKVRSVVEHYGLRRAS